jgi:hypothetical protein
MPPIQQWLVLFWSKLHETLLLLDKFLEHQIFPVGYTEKIGDMTQEGSLLILASVVSDAHSPCKWKCFDNPIQCRTGTGRDSHSSNPNCHFKPKGKLTKMSMSAESMQRLGPTNTLGLPLC